MLLRTSHTEGADLVGRVKKTAMGAAIALAIYLALLAAVSELIVRGTVGESVVSPCVWGFACLASFTGAKLSSRKDSEPAGQIALNVAVFWALILLCGLFVNDTVEPSHAAALLLPVLTGGALAYLLRAGKGKQKKGKGRRRFRK